MGVLAFRRFSRPVASCLALAVAGFSGVAAVPVARAAESDKALNASIQNLATQRIIYNPTTGTTSSVVRPFGPRGPGGCPPVVQSVTNCFDSINQGSEITLQLGMVEGEGFGSTYTIADPNPGTPQNEAFPIEVQLVEFFAATAGTGIAANITMGWTIEVWDGEPGLPNASLVFTVTSADPNVDPGLPPDISLTRVTGGTACTTNEDLLLRQLLGQQIQASAVKVQFSVDSTADPVDRMVVNGTSGTGLVSIVVKIDRHNQPGASPCTTVSFCNNAFLCTEGATITPCSTGTTNPAAPTFASRNWLSAISCAGGCPAGYTRFSNLATGLGGCRPSRDVVQQITTVASACVGVIQGACCNGSTGGCTLQTTANCSSVGGTYQGDNTVCSPNPCPQPTGACCNNTTGACTATTSTTCAGGTFQGVGTSCSPTPCPEPNGACCTNTGACASVTQTQCSQLGGSFIAGVACTVNNTCPLGACCLPDGSCVAGLSSPACSSQGGTFQGVSSACASVSCPQPAGACCTTTGGCTSVTQAVCSIFGGTWAGAFTTCPGACTPPAGLCCRGTTCAAGVAQNNCTPISNVGVAFASGSSCGTSPTAPCCFADYDKMGGIAVGDIFAYLNSWFASSPYTKFAGDGVAPPAVGDIFSFLNAWFAGGC